jgi:hypothetical protein
MCALARVAQSNLQLPHRAFGNQYQPQQGESTRVHMGLQKTNIPYGDQYQPQQDEREGSMIH